MSKGQVASQLHKLGLKRKPGGAARPTLRCASAGRPRCFSGRDTGRSHASKLVTGSNTTDSTQSEVLKDLHTPGLVVDTLFSDPLRSLTRHGLKLVYAREAGQP